MGIVAINPPIYRGFEWQDATVASSTAITAVGHKYAVVCQSPITGAIRRIHWRNGSQTGTFTFDVRVEQITSGRPNGTLWGTGTNGSQTMTFGGQVAATTLTADATVTKGQQIGIVFSVSSAGTSTTLSVFASSPIVNYPGLYIDSGSGYSAILSRSPTLAIEFADGTIVCPPGCVMASNATTSSIYSSGEQGIRFRYPIRKSVAGFWHTFDPDTTLTFRLYADATSPGGTALAETAQSPSDFRQTVSSAAPVLFPTSVTLEANTWYRFVAGVSAASSRFQTFTLPSTTYLPVSPFGELYQTVSSGSSWVDTPTTIPLMGPIIDGIDNGNIGIPLIGPGGLISV